MPVRMNTIQLVLLVGEMLITILGQFSATGRKEVVLKNG